MTNPVTNRTDTLEIWRVNLNAIGNNVGDPYNLYNTDGIDTFPHPTSEPLIAAINDLNTRKVKRSGDTIASLTVTNGLTGNTASFSGQVTSTVTTGTAPFIITSTTPVANLSIGGNAATATATANITGGATGSLVYQSGVNTTAFLSIGTANKVMGVDAAGTGLEYKSITSDASSINITYTAGKINLEASGQMQSTNIVGDVTIGSNPVKATIYAATGNFNTSGTLTVGSATQLAGLTIGTNKLTVDSSNGNLVTAGSMTSATASIGTATITTGNMTNGSVSGTMSYGSITDMQVATLTTTATTVGQVIASFPVATYRSAEFIIQAVDATNTKYHSATIKLIHDGSAVTAVEYAAATTANGSCGTFSADISGGNFRLLTTPASNSNTIFKATCILTKTG